MSLALATALVSAFGFYGILGLLYGLYFISYGASRVVPAARGAGIGFALIILPGAVLFWPLLLARLIKGQTRPKETPRALRHTHARIWVFLVPLLALGIMLTLMLKPVAPVNEKLPVGIILEGSTP
jgi:hypothetical protein